MHRALGLLAALALLAVGPLAALAAQEATPTATVEATLAALLQDADGVTVAVALLAEGGDGEVSVGVTAVGLSPGPHGIHIHETGVCDPAGDRAFASAGGHYNPTEDEHGDHAGDLGNIDADEDGTAVLRETTDAFGLDELLDEDGTSIVIHAEEDEDDPEGESYGARIACGVIAAPVAVEPTATVVPPAAALDTDGDGLTDEDEVNVHGTDPDVADTDGDGLTDGDEVNVHGTDPNLADTDGDGAPDGDEVAFGSDPNDPSDFPAVQAGPEGDEVDTDGDGLTDDDEANVYGTDPNEVDTDLDDVSDGDEVDAGTDPLDPASV